MEPIQQLPKTQGAQIPHINLPNVNMEDLSALLPEKIPQYVGKIIFPSIKGVFGDEIARQITGMLTDENVVNF